MIQFYFPWENILYLKLKEASLKGLSKQECRTDGSGWTMFVFLRKKECLSVYLFVCLSVCLFIICLSVYLFVCLSVYLFVCLSVCLFICLSVYHLFVCLSVYLFVCLSVCLFIYDSNRQQRDTRWQHWSLRLSMQNKDAWNEKFFLKNSLFFYELQRFNILQFN